MKTRLQKLMAEANIDSRRGSEELIEQGRVRVNGKVAKVGDKADPETDVVEVDGERLRFSPQNKIYFALYKPRQVLTTSLPHNGDERLTVLDLLPYKGHLFSIGRLDADSEGLVVLTNDGDLTQRLTHPRFHHTKTYKVTVRGLPTEDALKRWEEGVWLEEEGKTAPCSVTIVKGNVKETVLRIVMTEGKKRQIRRVALILGHPVESLVRTHIGMLSVEGLRPGEWRELTPRDVHALSTPSPVLKELKARRWALRQAETAQQRRPRTDQQGGEKRPRRRREAGDFEARPRQRSLVDDAPGETRPRRRPEGDTRSTERPGRGYSADKPSEGERPRRSAAAGDRPRRSFGDKPSGEDRPRRSFSDKPAAGDRPRRSFGDKPAGENRPRRSFSDKPAAGDRPRRSFSDKPASENRPRRSFGDKPTSQDRPRRPGSPSSEGARFDPRRPRRDGEGSAPQDRPRRFEGAAGDEQRPRRPAGDRPRRPAYRAEGENRPPREASGAGEDRPRRPRPQGVARSGESRPPRRDGEAGKTEDRPRSTTRTTNRPGERASSSRPRTSSGSTPRTYRGGSRPATRSGDRPPRRETSQTRRPPTSSQPSEGNEEE